MLEFNFAGPLYFIHVIFTLVMLFIVPAAFSLFTMLLFFNDEGDDGAWKGVLPFWYFMMFIFVSWCEGWITFL